ncbi:hypothetical protein HELRODRAFT_192311 [Helobdella robusta]|uniref:Amidohydrolase 3 domain-containing protein n=1 Tax=Helobdella robusta TaxID=6412 RepID=T1FTT5_HELRO|nr:hypothetical protein HELRODRAFT_192311 [Helobdella robusta]ESO01365.1 hypothetical protein HELRODRAFT_192311 [Helobdella robusta]
MTSRNDAKVDFHLAYNAQIYSTPPQRQYNTWMVFSKVTGFIESVGSVDAPVDEFKDDQKTDYQNKLILPGFHDSHLHLESYGESLLKLNLKNCKSFDEFKKLIADYRSKSPDLKWIEGSGWNKNYLGRFPTAEDIDEVCPDVPVIMLSSCRHAAVVNQLALNIAGIDENSSEPGIDKYPSGHPSKPNKPTGLLLEVPLLIRFQKNLPPTTSRSKTSAIMAAMCELLKNGTTSAHTCEENTWTEFCQLADENKLPMRIFYSAFITSKNHPTNFPNFPNEKRGSMLHFNKVKFFVDGSLSARTAALSLPYTDFNPEDGAGSGDGLGVLLFSEEEQEKMMKEVVGEGHRLEVHVIGDRAADVVLNIFDRIDLDPTSRPIFVHCEILRKDLIERMKVKGVIASIQPQFVVTDTYAIDSYLPEKLFQYAYTWKSILDHGICVAGGSDAPIEEPRSLMGMFDAVFRTSENRDLKNSSVFKPEECLSIEQAVDIYTQGGAFTAMMEDKLGQLKAGFYADFVVLDRDVISNPDQCLDAVVLETWVAGIRRWSIDEGFNF